MLPLLARRKDGEQPVYFWPTDVDIGSNGDVFFFFLNKTTTNKKQKFIIIFHFLHEINQ